MPWRVTVLLTSPRVAPGLLSVQAWDAVRGAWLVAPPGHPQLGALAPVSAVVAAVADAAEAAALVAGAEAPAAGVGRAVWLGAAEDGAAFAAAGLMVTVLEGSVDLPGARLLDLVAVMDRLRSPGGCPWDAEQTHRSLATYLLEETYETLEAIEVGDSADGGAHLREELGDLLLQVVFHSRIAEERTAAPWSIDDVAAGIAEKLVHRHPHVFGDAAARVTTAAEVEAGWERRKAVEKGRTSAVDGVPAALPALSLAAKLMARADRHGVDVPVPDSADSGADLGDRLLGLVADARRLGVDPEQALRAAARRYADAVRAAEAAGSSAGGPADRRPSG